MNLRTKIQKDINKALKKKERERMATLRFLWAQIQNQEIAQGRRELTDEEVVKLINRQIKNLKESLSFFEKGQREDLVKKAKIEIKILKSYLPTTID